MSAFGNRHFQYCCPICLMIDIKKTLRFNTQPDHTRWSHYRTNSNDNNMDAIWQTDKSNRVTYSNCQSERTYDHRCCWNRLTTLVQRFCSSLICPYIHYVLRRTFFKGYYTPLEARFFIEKPAKEMKRETFFINVNVWIVTGIV